jgi:hypothetical protein
MGEERSVKVENVVSEGLCINKIRLEVEVSPGPGKIGMKSSDSNDHLG